MKKSLFANLILVSFLAVPLQSIAADSAPISTDKPLYWMDPMEPNKHYTAPGKSDMGMELQPVYPKKNDNSTTPAANNTTNNAMSTTPAQ